MAQPDRRPVAWEQLATLKSGAQWTISTAREDLSLQKTDPWAGYWTSGQTPTAAMKVLGFRRARRNASPLTLLTGGAVGWRCPIAIDHLHAAWTR
ncbi:MAG: hypothetical protein M3461_15200 [Pseudomonadota bacterium]|nr:hypothetical protein [Pseudomonadota bacterium]